MIWVRRDDEQWTAVYNAPDGPRYRSVRAWSSSGVAMVMDPEAGRLRPVHDFPGFARLRSQYEDEAWTEDDIWDELARGHECSTAGRIPPAS